jgi:PAS domain S-box-containing protein
MKDDEKTKEQLINELAELRQRIIELEAAEAEHKSLRELVELLPEIVYEVDLEGNVTFANRSGLAAFGYSKEDIEKGVTVFQVIVPEEHEILKQNITRAMYSEDTGIYEYVALKKDGSRFPVIIHGKAIRDDAGTPVGIRGVAIDITERKLIEEALRESERELTIRNQIANIFLTIPDDDMYGNVLQVILEIMKSKHGVFGYIDEDGNLIYPSMTREVWKQCQVPDKHFIFPRETWGGLWGRSLIKKKILYSNEPYHVPEGHISIRRSLTAPITYQGEVIGHIHVGNKATDYDENDTKLLEIITNYIAPVLHARLQRDRQEKKRKLAEEALHKSEERFRNIFAQSPIGIELYDTEGHLRNARYLVYLMLQKYEGLNSLKTPIYQLK